MHIIMSNLEIHSSEFLTCTHLLITVLHNLTYFYSGEEGKYIQPFMCALSAIIAYCDLP